MTSDCRYSRNNSPSSAPSSPWPRMRETWASSRPARSIREVGAVATGDGMGDVMGDVRGCMGCRQHRACAGDARGPLAGSRWSHQFHTQLTAHNLGGSLQAFDRGVAIVGIEQTIELRATGLHQLRHALLGELFFLHFLCELPRDDGLDGG